MRRRQVVWWSVGAASLTFLVLLGIAAWQLRPERVRDRITIALAQRLNADVTIERLNVTYLPRMRLTADDVALRIKDRADLPPFVSIAHLSIDLGLLSATRRHVETMHVDGLVIQVPPKEARRTLGAANDETTEPSAVERAL